MNISTAQICMMLTIVVYLLGMLYCKRSPSESGYGGKYQRPSRPSS